MAERIGDPLSYRERIGKLEADRDALLVAIEEHQGTSSFYCNKCGYIGDLQVHAAITGCGYYAARPLANEALYSIAKKVRDSGEES